jgi:TPR repeat protein
MAKFQEQTRVATIYNPQTLSKDQLIGGFVARQANFQKLFQAIKDGKMEVPEQHYLLLGRRGLGKTSMLLRLAYAIEDDADLNQWMVPIVFNEEEYGIRRLFKVWERIIELLIQKHPDLGDMQVQQKKIAEREKDDTRYEEALFNYLSDELQKHKFKLVLFIDNFGDLTRKFTTLEAHRLRKILQTSSDLRVFGASSVVLEVFFQYDHPFYEFFKTVTLEGLNQEETKALLLNLATHYKREQVERIVKEEPGRVEALRRIAGGVIRTMVLLFEIFADDEDGNAFKDLESILDRTTPLYKHRMDDLSDQQQAIVEAIAQNWDAISVKEIVESTRLDSKTVSSQLQILEKEGVIEKRPTKTKNNLYLIAERFFNIWFLMRLGRRNDEKRVLWLVRFFEDWCDGDMLTARVLTHKLALTRGGIDPQAALIYSQAMAQTGRLSLEHKHSLLTTTREYLMSENHEGLAAELPKSELDKAYELVLAWKEDKSEAVKREIFKTMAHLDWKKKVKNDQARLIHFFTALAAKFYVMQPKDVQKSLNCIIEAALLNETNSMYDLGSLYEKEYGDIEKAIEWYEKASASGNADVMNKLGSLYENEYKDFEKARDWYKKASLAGNAGAMFNLGWFYQSEYKDLGKAREWYEKAAALGIAGAMINLGLLYTNEFKDLEKAKEWYEKAVAAGNAEAMFSLGWFYQSEYKDLGKAREWYEKAAALGIAGAMINLGVLYKNEFKDLEKAKEWYEKAVAAGSAGAVFNLGWFYQSEYKDLGKAREWYEKAAALGIAGAMINLGLLYTNEFKDLEKAKEWYEKAVAAGNAEAMFSLGWFYQSEYKDLGKAREWYEKAAALGIAGAMINLGVLYKNEFKDLEKAKEWYEKAVASGSADAMNNLGILYTNEYKDLVKAREWYEKAAAAGDTEAMNRLAWDSFIERDQLQGALPQIEAALEKEPTYSWYQHTAACIYAWSGNLEKSKQFTLHCLEDAELLDSAKIDFTILFSLLIAKGQAKWLLDDVFQSSFGERQQLKDRFKPLYYAVLKQLHHPDLLRMGDELIQTVDEILAKTRQMAVDYAH